MKNIFLSHSSSDKSFARRLGNVLRGKNFKVWIDEAEIKVGDSLIEKISEGIDSTDYLVVVLSKESCKSEWVKREVNIALTQEINQKKVKVLPCVIEECNIPPFLLDKKYADFKTNFVDGRSELLESLGVSLGDPTQIFLNQHIFYDLKNLNNGFDVNAIQYFNHEDFEIILSRIQQFGLGIYGIEPWQNGEFVGVKVHEDYYGDPFDPDWYWTAFEEFCEEGVKSHFSASYAIPEKVLINFIKEYNPSNF
ncbi:toll/interleukin-1 receptor domain-containing protein [Fodinibius halophilus]|uniref:Toll/interleukin-1 receptor domain-containing protein n=1 Tax=Fodinibius halophilus TaxID=1736908 RepID=A0A6M1T853_9BACT|nr:toll/interleukin-1 receptor domain-containing protein [Fodinibius halophilus]NGP90259.1 toll/interleukin-1 receptor domain-containing protein [Fodinibius halophilus]